MSIRKELLKSANPNAHGKMKVYRFTDMSEDILPVDQFCYVVTMPGEHSDDGQEFADEAEAVSYFDAEVARLQDTPNWEAQARYDEAHGTDNGFSPWDRLGY
jgi:hypothetical protein